MAGSSRPEWWPPRVLGHALQRYQAQYPDATVRDVLWEVSRGEEVDRDLVAALTCCPARARGRSLYIAGVDKRGIFVLEPSMENADQYAWTAITYLRLEESQRAILAT